MSERERGPRDACERYAPTLAMRDAWPDLTDALLDSAERIAALDHLAGCARCQADQRADARIDDDLRRAFAPNSPAGASPLRTRDLLAAIGATSEPAAMPRWAARPTRDAIRSVIYLGDFDGGFQEGFERMSEQVQRQEREEREERTGHQTPPVRQAERPERTMAAIPSLRPAPRRLGPQAWAMGFGATAAAVVLIVVAATLFASRPRPIATQTAHVGATQTASAQGAEGGAPGGAIVAISMDSPTDGWALGDATGQQAGPVQPKAALYHYDGSHWRLAQQAPGVSVSASPSSVSLKMLSPTDGWALADPSHLLHYDGTSWRAVTITLAPEQEIPQLLSVDMVSSSDGWAAGLFATGSPQPTLVFLHYDGRQWSVEPNTISLPGLDTNTLTIGGISATPDGDVWAVGYAGALGAQGNEPQVGLIFQRSGGMWRMASRLNQATDAVQLIPRNILMLGPNDGWIVGDTEQTTTAKEVGGSTVAVTTTHALLLRYDGARWTQVPAPLSTPTSSDRLSQIVATTPDSLWVTVQSDAISVLPSGAQFSGDLLHYDGKTWSEVPPALSLKGPTSVWLAAVSPAGAGTLWAAGGTETVQNQQSSLGPFMCLYANGAWSVVSLDASGK